MAKVLFKQKHIQPQNIQKANRIISIFILKTSVESKVIWEFLRCSHKSLVIVYYVTFPHEAITDLQVNMASLNNLAN